MTSTDMVVSNAMSSIRDNIVSDVNSSITQYDSTMQFKYDKLVQSSICTFTINRSTCILWGHNLTRMECKLFSHLRTWQRTATNSL